MLTNPNYKCYKCKEIKDRGLFYKDKSKYCGHCSICKECTLKRYSLDPKRRKRVKQYNKSRHHEIRWKNLYGLTQDQYNFMLEEQKGVCYLCRRKYDIRLSVDHCHITNKIRGLLCSHCNLGLGLFKDDIKVLKRAVQYLKR